MDRQAIKARVMHDFKHGRLRDAHGRPVISRNVAMAIAINSANRQAHVDLAEPAPVSKLGPLLAELHRLNPELAEKCQPASGQLPLFAPGALPAPAVGHQLVFCGIEKRRERAQLYICDLCQLEVRVCKIRGAGEVRYYGEQRDPLEPPCRAARRSERP